MDCPLCMDLLEPDDRKFYPCSCKYQICRFCWHRIRTDENGLCPACRKPYTDMPDDFEPISHTIVQQLKQKKKQRDMQRKQKIMDNKKELGNVRVVQRNLVFVVGLSARLANSEILRKSDYFGKFGKLIKVVINRNASYAGSQTHPQGPSASAYVTYHRPEDALRAIQAVNNIHMDGRTLRASLGTTKYCSNFMNNQMCPKMDCMYLHDIGEANATFTKEEMQKGLHQEFERKLHEKYLGKSNYTSREKAKQERLVVNGASDTKHSKKNSSNGHTENNSTREQKNAWLTTSKDSKRTRTRSERNADTNTTNDEHNNKGIRVRNGRDNHEAAASNSSTSSSPSSEQSNPHTSNHNCELSPSPSPSPPPVEETKVRKGKNLQPSDAKKQRPKASSPMAVKGATSGENSLAATPSSLSSCSELSLSLPNTLQLESTRSRRQKKNERQERNKAKNEISNDHNDSEETAISDVIAVNREDEDIKLKNRDRSDKQKTKGKNKNLSKANEKEKSISSHSFFSEPNEVELDSDESKEFASSPVVTNGQYDSHDIEENDTEWPSISPDHETTLMCDLERSIEETQETTSPSNEPPWEAMFDMESSTRLESPSEPAEIEQKPVEDEIYVEDELGFDPFEETNKALANDILMERKQQQHHQLQLQQQQLLRQQQHQLLLQQKQQQIEQQNFQNQLRLQSGLKGLMDNYSVKDLLATRLPPPGFNGTSMSQPLLKHLGNPFGNTVSPPSLAQNGAALNRVGMTNGALNFGLNSNGFSMPLDTTSGAPPGLLSAGKIPGNDAFTLKDLETGLGGLGALRGAGNGFPASISTTSATNPLSSIGAMQQSTQQSSISALFNMAQQQQQIQLQQQQLHQLQQQQHALSQQNLIHHLGTNFTNSTKGWPPSGAACELTALDPAIVSSGQVTERRAESPAQPHWLKPLDADSPAWASNTGAVPSSFSLLTSRRTAASKHVSGSNLGWTAPSPPPGFNTISPMQHVKSQLHKIENL